MSRKGPLIVKRRARTRGAFLKGVNTHLKNLKRFPPKLPIASKTIPTIPGTKNL
jgi:hypothetical protein